MRLLYKTSQYFHVKKNDTGYLLFVFIIFKLRSTTEQTPALVKFEIWGLFTFFLGSACRGSSLSVVGVGCQG
jgi:hypothetical protein